MTSPGSGGCDCAILLFPPASGQGQVQSVGNYIDQVSGEHGYTHVAVECCDSAGQPVAIDAAPKWGLGYSPLSRWTLKQRPYGRVAVQDLSHLGVSCPDFCQRAHDLAKKRLPYSLYRIAHLFSPLSAGLILSAPPNGIFCTDVVTQCLPDPLVLRMHTLLQKIRPKHPNVSGYGSDGVIFISPNGLAYVLGLPPGETLTSSGQPLTPNFLC